MRGSGCRSSSDADAEDDGQNEKSWEGRKASIYSF